MDKNDAYGRVTYINLDDDDELFSWYGWPTKGVALFPAGTIVIDSQHHESSTRREKQSFADVLQNICSENFCKFHSKTTVLEPLFAKGVVPQDCSFIKRSLQHRCFPVKFATFLRTLFYWTPPMAASVIFSLEYLSFMWQGLMGEQLWSQHFHFFCSVLRIQFIATTKIWKKKTSTFWRNRSKSLKIQSCKRIYLTC